MRSKKTNPEKGKGMPKWKKGLVALGILMLISLLGMVYSTFRVFNSNNVVVKEHESNYILIPTGATFETVTKLLQKQGLLIHPTYFQWAARYLHYPENVKAGRYLVKKGMSSKELIEMLASGKQEPVKVVISGSRTKEQLANKLARQLEPDSSAFLEALKNPEILDKFDLTQEAALSLVIPDTYEIYWNCTPQQFISKLVDNYRVFWNDSRRRKAEQMGFTPLQVSVLASIVDQESKKKDEQPIIAGVYINRLHEGQKLEADPTLVYALGNFSVRRVLNGYKDIDSPYNTYKYTGLPPGPICIPSNNAVDAVLNYSKHKYLYFCAREDFSGYHSFACTYVTHLVNARKYQKELNRRNIKS